MNIDLLTVSALYVLYIGAIADVCFSCNQLSTFMIGTSSQGSKTLHCKFRTWFGKIDCKRSVPNGAEQSAHDLNVA